MPMIHQFSSPRAALLWQYGRGFFWFAVLGAPVSAFLGVMDAGIVAPEAPAAFLFAIVTVPLLVAMEVGSEWGFRAFQWRLPVSTRSVVLIEVTMVLGLMLWFLFNYAIAYRLFSPLSTLPTPWGIPFVVALGLIGLLLPRSFEAMEPRTIALGTGAAALAAIVAHWSLAELFGPAVGDYSRLPAVLVFILGAGYAMALHCTGVVRHGGLPLREDIVQRIQSLLAPTDNDARLEARTPARLVGVPPLPSQRKSAMCDSRAIQMKTGTRTRPAAVPFVDTGYFASPVGAQAWYELRDFRDPLKRLYRLMVLVYCPLFALMVGKYIPGDPGVLRFACSLSLLLWFHIMLSPPDAFSLRMPLSDWTRSLVYFRLSWPVLAILGPTLWLMACLNSWAIIENPHPAYFSLPGVVLLLGATLWVGWISLALGPVIFFTASLTTLYHHSIGKPPATLLGVLLALLCVCSLAASRSRIANQAFFPDGAACVASAALVLGGYLFMAHYPLPPLVRWACREGLGALLILSILRHHAATGLIPADASRRLMYSLVGGIAAFWLVVLVLGPPREPEHGIAAIYLAFGMVPPIFLPFLLMPHYVQLARNMEEGREEMRRFLPWLK